MSDQSYTRVRDVMSHEPILIDGMAPVRDAIQLMHKNRVSSLIIDKRHEGDEYGIVMIHDIAEKIVSADKSPDRVSVYEIMSKPVLSVEADMDIKYATRLLFRFGLHRALVLDRRELGGIVTLRDLVLRPFVD